MDYNDKMKELEEAKRQLAEIEKSKAVDSSNGSDVERGGNMKQKTKALIIAGIVLLVSLLGVGGYYQIQAFRIVRDNASSTNSMNNREVETVKKEDTDVEVDMKVQQDELDTITEEDVDIKQEAEIEVNESVGEITVTNRTIVVGQDLTSGVYDLTTNSDKFLTVSWFASTEEMANHETVDWDLLRHDYPRLGVVLLDGYLVSVEGTVTFTLIAQ